MEAVLRLDALLLATLCLNAGCATSRHTVATKGVPPCSAAALPPTPSDWARTDQGDGFSLALPASCVTDVDAPRRWHGGGAWKCGSINVSIAWGMWGRSSFAHDDTICTTKLQGTRALVLRNHGPDTPRYLVWYMTGSVHEPVVSASSELPSDDAAARSIAYSGHRLPAAK